VPSSGPKPISHTTVQHINNPDFVGSPEPARATELPLTDDLNKDLGASDSNDEDLPLLGDPERKLFGEMTLPSISLMGVAFFKWLIDVGGGIHH